MAAHERVSTVAERLSELLKERRIKNTELSDMTGLPKGSISNWCHGKYEPKQTALYQIGKALNVSEMWLAGFDVPKERTEGQKANDEFADVIARMQTDLDFRKLVISINGLTPMQVQTIQNLIAAFHGGQK